MTKPPQILDLSVGDHEGQATNRSPPIRNLALLGSVNLAFVPSDGLTIAWLISGAALMVIVAAVFLLRKYHVKKHAMSPSKERELWEQIEQAAKARMSKRERVEGRSRYDREPETRPVQRSPGDHARSVQALFQTLHEDRPVASGVEASQEESKNPYATRYEPTSNNPYATPYDLAPFRQHDFSPPQQLDDPSQHGSPQGPPRRAYSEAAIPAMHHAPMSGQPSFGSLQPSKSLQSPPGGFDAPVATAGQDLPFAIRQDTTHRLEADLAWVRPQANQPPEWAPGFVRRAKREKQARQFHRLSRQVTLVNHLLNSPDKQLQRIGVETAIRLEKQLHAERAKKMRGRRALRK